MAENLFLKRLPRNPVGWIAKGRLREQARAAMTHVGLDAIDPDTPIGALGISCQQMIEIAHNLIGDCRVLILNEPTAMLTSREVDLGPRRIGAPRLTATGLKRGTAVRDVSFDVREGEIFGISGLIGPGRTVLLRLVFGVDRASAARSRWARRRALCRLRLSLMRCSMASRWLPKTARKRGCC
ncbi:hypothetical protein KPG66_07085 [Mycetohabitans sp. B2]|nr:hypothetical protein [Mycetohabitans sp. B2]